MLNRRLFLAAAAASLATGCASSRRIGPGPARPGTGPVASARISPEYLTMYRAMPEERFPVPAVDLTKIDPLYYRQLVDYAAVEPAGTIIVDTPNRFLYLTMENGKAMRYGVGIGRAGFAWGGRAKIQYKKAWPTWTPPKEMIERDPDSAKWANGMPGGPDNPLGARALYLYEGNRDSIYRIHGTNQPWSIGLNISSGCIRMNNDDVTDLYSRVEGGAKVIVLMQGAALYKGV